MNKIYISLLILLALAIPGQADSLSGRVYAGNASSGLDQVYPLYYAGTTQEYYNVYIYNRPSQYLAYPHVSPNFFYFGCIGLASDCDDTDNTGGEVYVDEFDVSGSQALLQVHTPWDTWVDSWVQRNSYLIITYTGAELVWVGATYTIYLETFVGNEYSGVTLKTQLVTPNNFKPSYFYDPLNIGVWLSSSYMPFGYGSLSNGDSRQEIMINTEGINVTGIASYKIRVLMNELTTGGGGHVVISEPYIPLLQSYRNELRLTGSVLTHVTYITNGNPMQWYDVTGFTTPLASDSKFSIGLSSNIQILGLDLVVTYNTSQGIPLSNVLIRGLNGAYLTSSTATTNDSGYYNISILESESEILFNGWNSYKLGNRWYGEMNTSTFAGGNVTGWDVYLNETVTDMTGSLLFNQNTSSVAVGQSMNVSYALYHPNLGTYEFSIDLYKPISDFSGTMIFDTSILVTSDGNWVTEGDKTTQGIRRFYLNATHKTTGAVTTLATLDGVYGSIEAWGNISVNQSTYIRPNSSRVNYSTSVNGRIIFYSDQNGYYSVWEVGNGSNQYMILPITASFEYGIYVASLQYEMFADDWTTLNQTTFQVLPGASLVQFESDNYTIGQSIGMSVYQTTDGRLVLSDPSSVEKLNITGMNVGNFSFNTYFTRLTDTPGTWTARLYNSIGVLVSTDTTPILIFNGTVDPIQTSDGYEECPSGADFCSGYPMSSADVWANLGIYLPFLGMILIICLILSAVAGAYKSWSGK